MIKAFLQNLVTAASLCCFAEHVNAEKGRHYPIKTSDDKDALDFLNQITASKSQNAQIVKPRVEQQPVRGPNGSDIDRFLPRKMDYTSLTETLPPPKNALFPAPLKSASSATLVLVPDGGYEFEGHTFIARISASGKVSFQKKCHFGYVGGTTFNLGIPSANSEEVFEAEKQDFLMRKDVRAAIDKITEQAEQKIAPRVEAELEKIWNAPGSTLQAKKQKLFDYWQYLSIFLQPIVFRFIDRHLPQGSASEYTKEELFLYQKEGFFPYGKQRQ